MKAEAFVKKHQRNEFYVKPIPGCYYGVFDGYDKSLASVEATQEDADTLCCRLNQARNNRLKLK